MYCTQCAVKRETSGRWEQWFTTLEGVSRNQVKRINICPGTFVEDVEMSVVSAVLTPVTPVPGHIRRVTVVAFRADLVTQLDFGPNLCVKVTM